MPHYSDGTEAKVGDTVYGKPYNTPHKVTGVVVGITPDQDECNLRVVFAQKAGDLAYGVAAFNDGLGTPIVTVRLERDYGATKEFSLIHREGK